MVPASECAEGMQGPHMCTSPDQLAKRQTAANSEVDQNRPTSQHRVACPLDTKNNVFYRKIVRLSPTPPLKKIKTQGKVKSNSAYLLVHTSSQLNHSVTQHFGILRHELAYVHCKLFSDFFLVSIWGERSHQ